MSAGWHGHIEFTGRCPSKAQVVKAVKTLLTNHDHCAVQWGENEISITRMRSAFRQGVVYRGYGWIRKTSGDDIAHEMNVQNSN